ncbi:MAG: DUF4198 domain-containing protein [Planctomycetaceae bacterium]|nr:DUF4198 domain-containing protein [Planctomycetaceae bacterium]
MTRFLMAALVVAWTTAAQAHFIWLEPIANQDGSTTVQVYFAEDAFPDDPKLLRRLGGLQVWKVTGTEAPQPLKLVPGEETLTAAAADAADAVFVASHDLGVLNRGDAVFRLKYYAKTGPAVTSNAWESTVTSDDLKFDIVPRLEGGRLWVTVRFDGQPIAGAQVVASGPGMDDFEGVTTSDGQASFEPADGGLYSIRARYIEPAAGELDGKAYQDTRHYTTLALALPGESDAATTRVSAKVSQSIPPLPQPVTSFGGAVCNDYLYVYGGHTGGAHSYSTDEQGHELRRVALAGGEWETVADGPPLQGLALVSHGGKLYRIGGFTAKNAEGESHDLWSQDGVAVFDPATKEWSDLPALPEPRSSHDAAVVGDVIYVVGGWAMAGEGNTVWHDTAWAMDLKQQPLAWKPLPSAPFHRRALTAAAHNGKLYVIGGMQQEGGPTPQVAIYDPSTGAWSEGPALVSAPAEKRPEAADASGGDRRRGPGDLTGFGASAFATGGHLYVSTIKGDLQRLNADGTAWEIISQTPTARFFHRLLPVDDERLLVVGGANMGTGKFDEVEILHVD